MRVMRFRTRSLLLVPLLLVPVSAALAAAPPPAADPQALAPRVDALFAPFTQGGSPGCALGVVRDGRIVYAKGYGLANLGDSVAIDPRRTVFDIGSTSKQFTAASVLLLAKDGKLALDDDIHKYIPELASYGTPVTLRHLLHHTSGMRDYINLMTMGDFTVEDYTTDADALAALARQKKLDFPPGSEHRYSNSGYFLLSLVVQRVSGKTLRDFAQGAIFTPLGMSHTQYLNDHTAVVPHRATAYAPRDGEGFRIAMSNWEQTGDGGVNTTVEDLAKWDQNFYDPKVGGPELLAELQTTGQLADGTPLEYARGLVVSPYRGLRTVSHGGAWAGYRAELLRFPDQKFSVIALCNLATANPTHLADQVADLYLADRLAPEPAAPAVQSPAAAPALSAADAARYAGLYWSPVGGIVRRIEARDGRLFYVRGEGNESPLGPVAPPANGRFRFLDAPATDLAFLPTPPGAPRRLEVRAGTNKPLAFEEEQPPVNLQPGDLAAYAGTYNSAELDTVWILQLENGRLVLHPKRGEVMPLDPLFADTFQGPAGPMRFARDGARKVTGFTTGVGRARELGFTKGTGG